MLKQNKCHPIFSGGICFDFISLLHFQEPFSSFYARRLQLLLDQKAALEAQMADTQRMLDKLEYKISRYQVAVKTGKLTWD